MSKNIDQVYIANPITSNASTDLMYFGQSPYGAGDDAAMTYANFSAQFGAPYTAAALTSSNDTNITLTLGGTPSTALLHAASITAGWTGQLAVGRGGTGAASFNTNGVVISNTTTTGALTSLALTDGQIVIGSSTGAPAAASLTAGSNITITPGHNTITIAASGGGSSPWTAGAGTDSAIGGDGTETAAGNYALCYGDASSTAAGTNSITFGHANTNNANHAFVAGENNFTGSSATAAAIFGNNSACVAAYQFAAGNNNNVNGNSTASFCIGQNNTVNGSSVASGAMGDSCTVSASASHAFALGYSSTTLNSGSWVISDGTGTNNSDTAVNQFVMTFAGGYYLYGGQLNISTAGKGLSIKSGSNCKLGTATLSSGTITVSNTAITSNSKVFLTIQSASGTVGTPYLGTVTAGTSFVINSTNALDNSVVAYMIVEAA